jgi:hypothetical protein
MNPFSLFPDGPGRLLGLNVIESPDIPRYQLPEELIPGVPWDPKFRAEINRWAKEFLGTTNVIPRGTAYMLANQFVVMRPGDAVKLINIAS